MAKRIPCVSHIGRVLPCCVIVTAADSSHDP